MQLVAPSTSKIMMHVVCPYSWKFSSTTFVRLSLSAAISFCASLLSFHFWLDVFNSLLYIYYIIYLIFLLPRRILLIPLHLLRQFALLYRNIYYYTSIFFPLLLGLFFSSTIDSLDFYFILFTYSSHSRGFPVGSHLRLQIIRFHLYYMVLMAWISRPRMLPRKSHPSYGV